MAPKASTPPFRPQTVFVEKSVQDLPDTKRILDQLGIADCQIIKDAREVKIPREMTAAKKGLLLARHKPAPLKEFVAMTESTGRPTYSLNLISNCHLECTYCILQSYLANNPVIAIYTNMDEIMEKLEDQMDRIPRGSVIGTGQIADSLALEELSQHHQRLIPFFGTQDRVQLELKTKSDAVAPLLKLKHKGQTTISWSLAPERVQKGEEFKTAPIQQRIEAMQECQKAGYPIGVHLDPVVHHTGWEKNYKVLIEQIFSAIDAKGVSWTSVGTLRFPVRQVRIMQERFPKNQQIFKNLVSTNRRFMHYPDRLRESIYARIQEYLSKYLPKEKIYLSMEAEQSDPEESA